MARSLYIWGVLLITLGVFVLAFARPILTWDRIVIEDFGYEFDYPDTWSVKHDQSTIGNGAVPRTGEETTLELEDTGVSDLSNQDMEAYDVRLSEMTGSATIHVMAISFPKGTLHVESIAIIEKAQELRHDDYLVLYRKSAQVDRWDAFRRMAMYTVSGQDKPELRMEVVTYVIRNNTLYCIALIEHSWLSLPRNLKIYNHILKTFHIH
jgi:hypothetical protein